MNITRYPPTENKSLRAWSAADEYILKELSGLDTEDKTLAICNDRFGYLGCNLNTLNPFSVVDYKSQEIALRLNMEKNGLQFQSDKILDPLTPAPEKLDFGILHIPKSLDLFRFYLDYLSKSLADDGIVICGFMTRHFSPQLLSIADEYFEEAEQSLAWKKSRTLTLRKKRPAPEHSLINTILYTFKNGTTQEIEQYAGVFSSGNIDYATQFLLESLALNEEENTILDLAAGNGVIARAVQLEKPGAEIHLMDDSFLAVESSKRNLEDGNTHFHWTDSLDEIDDVEFDLVVSNPPFHFGHEVNTEVSVDLFREVAGRLKPGGRFLCVANKHLGYIASLKKFFTTTNILAENKKFIVYEAKKGS
ncbi:MAG: class I SAM-dependent methyltransferase [Balneolaceae bacterium]|nr:class I SAM-dependent methyltransferase [Balneolaceae bacterium]